MSIVIEATLSDRHILAGCPRPSGELRAWERTFVADLPVFPRISTKQRYVLATIADRVLGRETPQ